MRLRFSARSQGAVLRKFAWGTITDFDNQANARSLEFVADGKSHEYGIDFPAEGHLAKLTFDFGESAGEVDFDWIALYRRADAKDELITEWGTRPGRIG
jgi:hypothetical protein